MNSESNSLVSRKKLGLKVGLLVGLCASVIFIMVSSVDSNATATIVYPRFGCAIQGPRTAGPGFNTTRHLEEEVTFWVAPDPVESPIPTSWYAKSNWAVALTPSVMPTANCTPLQVIDIISGPNQLVLFGGGLDVNPVYPSAVGLVCKVPADIAPVTHNLAIGFKTPLTPERQTMGKTDLIPQVGSWRGPKGSASGNLIFGNQPFLLSERNVISFPWTYDARTSDSGNDASGKNLMEPFQVMHVTDVHYYQYNEDWLGNNSAWETDSQVIAPDLLVLSGDVMERNDDADKHGAAQYELAYSRLSALNLPMVIVSGNHDNYNLGPWKHYFGPLFMTTRFDDLKVVGFDSILPISSGILNWIDQQAQPVNNGPVLMTTHYNIDPSYFSSGWVGIADIMQKRGTDGILVGHTHSDLVGPVGALQDAVFSNVDKIISGGEEDLETILQGVLAKSDPTTPIQEPQIIMTRSAAKHSGVAMGEMDFTDDDLDYSGYRLLTIQENKVCNYTYDYNGDGIRDPQVSWPVGLYKVHYESDVGLGTEPNAGVTWVFNNTSTETIVSARATFLVPRAPNGSEWNLDLISQGLGGFIRTQFSNATHSWIDARVLAHRNAVTRLTLIPA